MMACAESRWAGGRYSVATVRPAQWAGNNRRGADLAWLEADPRGLFREAAESKYAYMHLPHCVYI